MSRQPRIPPMAADPFRNGGGVQVETRIAKEEILHACRFSFHKGQGPNGQTVWMIAFDVPAGPGVAHRITVPFDDVSMGRFEDKLRAFRSGVALP